MVIATANIGGHGKELGPDSVGLQYPKIKQTLAMPYFKWRKTELQWKVECLVRVIIYGHNLYSPTGPRTF